MPPFVFYMPHPSPKVNYLYWENENHYIPNYEPFYVYFLSSCDILFYFIISIPYKTNELFLSIIIFLLLDVCFFLFCLYLL